jgi:putative MATE family efflux protein
MFTEEAASLHPSSPSTEAVAAVAADAPSTPPQAQPPPHAQAAPRIRRAGTGVIRPDATPQQMREAVIRLAWPAVVEFTLVTLVGVVNMVMVGRVGPQAVAAIGICNQPLFLAQAVFQALTVGSTAIVARHIGAGETPQAADAARQSVVLTAALAAVTSLPFVLWARQIVVWMGAKPDVVPLAESYIRIVGGGMLFTVMAIVVAAILRGAGDTHTPMRVNGVANVVNAAVGFVLIFGHLGFPAMGVAGAAWGAVAARGVGSALFLWTLYSGRAGLPLSLRQSHRPKAATVRRIFAVGLPSAMEQFVMRGGQVLFARIIASLGTLAYAAHQLTINAESLAFMPAQALGTAATTLVGQNLGAGQPHIADRSAKETWRLALALLSIIGVLIFVFTDQIIRMYTTDREVIAMARFNMRLFAVALPGMATYFVLVGGLRGAGDTRWPLYVSVAGIWCIRLVFANYLALRLNLGLPGAWYAMVLDHWSRALFCYLRFRSGKWMEARV